jgi:hypothetical protein
MNPKILGVVAILATAAGAVALKTGEAVDVEAVVVDPATGEKSVTVLRCRQGAKEGELDCGEVAATTEVKVDTASAPYLSLSSAGAKTARESPCACGPVDAKRVCSVTVTGMDGKSVTRQALPGEHLVGGAWSGDCPLKDCWEHSAIIEQRGLGYATPPECGGSISGRIDYEPPLEVPPEVEAKP